MSLARTLHTVTSTGQSTSTGITNLATYAVSTGQSILADAWIVGRGTTGNESVARHVTGLYERWTTGDVTQVGANASLLSVNDTTSPDAALTSSGTNILVYGVGTTSTSLTLEWFTVLQLQIG